MWKLGYLGFLGLLGMLGMIEGYEALYGLYGLFGFYGFFGLRNPGGKKKEVRAKAARLSIAFHQGKNGCVTRGGSGAYKHPGMPRSEPVERVPAGVQIFPSVMLQAGRDISPESIILR